MTTEKLDQACPACGGGPVWRISASDGQRVTLECTACPWWQVSPAA